MSLKYYSDEHNRYGNMGNCSKENMYAALEKAYVKFGLPRIDLKFARTPRRASWAKVGLGMVHLNGKSLAQPLSLPTIKMAPNHMNWQIFSHELAHHVHYVRYNTAIAVRATAAGINPGDTSQLGRLNFRAWLLNNVKPERAHGHTHRKIMQEVVDFFREIGMITELPTYVKQARAFEEARNRPINPEVLAMAAGM